MNVIRGHREDLYRDCLDIRREYHGQLPLDEPTRALILSLTGDDPEAIDDATLAAVEAAARAFVARPRTGTIPKGVYEAERGLRCTFRLMAGSLAGEVLAA